MVLQARLVPQVLQDSLEREEREDKGEVQGSLVQVAQPGQQGSLALAEKTDHQGQQDPLESEEKEDHLVDREALDHLVPVAHKVNQVNGVKEGVQVELGHQDLVDPEEMQDQLEKVAVQEELARLVKLETEDPLVQVGHPVLQVQAVQQGL